MNSSHDVSGIDSVRHVGLYSGHGQIYVEIVGDP
jgi:hypothetical protein